MWYRIGVWAGTVACLRVASPHEVADEGTRGYGVAEGPEEGGEGGLGEDGERLELRTPAGRQR